MHEHEIISNLILDLQAGNDERIWETIGQLSVAQTYDIYSLLHETSRRVNQRLIALSEGLR